MPLMIIGTKVITHCGECPGYEWLGESRSRGDHGYQCEFGAFSNDYVNNKKIPKNCPLAPLNNHEKINELLIEENCGECIHLDMKDDENDHCHAHKYMVKNCPDKIV